MHLEHEHDCGHTHDHPHHERNTPMTIRTQPRRAMRLIALMRYMVGHNVSHTNELKELAHKLAHTGEQRSLRAQILDAVRITKPAIRSSQQVWISFKVTIYDGNCRKRRRETAYISNI